MTETQKEEMKLRILIEAQGAIDSKYSLPMVFSLSVALEIVSVLQLALRHPRFKNTRMALGIRQIIDAIAGAMRADGWIAHAELAAFGNDPCEDEKP